MGDPSKGNITALAEASEWDFSGRPDFAVPNPPKRFDGLEFSFVISPDYEDDAKAALARGGIMLTLTREDGTVFFEVVLPKVTNNG